MTKRHFREWYILNIYFYKVLNTLLGLGLLEPPQYWSFKVHFILIFLIQPINRRHNDNL